MKSTFNISKSKKKYVAFFSSIGIHAFFILAASTLLILNISKDDDKVKFESIKRIAVSPINIQHETKPIQKKINPTEVNYIPVKKIVIMPKIVVPDVNIAKIENIKKIDLLDDTLLDEPIEELIVKVDKIEGSIDVSDTKNKTFQPKPEYPLNLQLKNISGSVKVEFLVNKEGGTEKIRIIETSHPGFNRSVVEALKKWKFGPQHKEFTDTTLFTFKTS